MSLLIKKEKKKPRKSARGESHINIQIVKMYGAEYGLVNRATRSGGGGGG